MAFLTSQAVMPMFTNIPKDVVTNTMHWETGAVSDDVAATNIASRLTLFYNTCFNIAGTAAAYINWSASIVKVYNLADPMPRSPITKPLPIVPLSESNTIVPTEVACVLSYYAAPESGTPAGRLRNRIYLGGLGTAAIATGTDVAFPTINPGFRVDILDAAEALAAGNTGSTDWVQRSSVGLITSREIAGAWVDNTPDTQRRRGVVASARSVRSFA